MRPCLTDAFGGSIRYSIMTQQEYARRRGFALLLVMVCLLRVTAAQAGSGFQLRSQSATSLGSAQAGMTAGADDSSLMIHNPAAAGFGSGTDLVVNGTGIFTGTHFTGGGATTFLGTQAGGNAGGNGGTIGLLPSFYAVADLAPNVRAGLAVTSLFGLGSFWDSGWAGRYYSLNAQVTTIDMVPTVTWRPIPTLTLGVGIIAEYAEVKSSAAIDGGSLTAAFGGTPGGNDAAIALRASGWAPGLLLGAIYEPMPGTRLGLSLRSRIDHGLSGTARFSGPNTNGAGISGVTGLFNGTNVQTSLAMPATASIGVSHKVTDRLTIMADAQWMQWSAEHALLVTYANPAQPANYTALRWHDSWFVTAGARYQLTDTVAIRGGVAWDQSPTRLATNTPAIPEGDSIWLAGGLEYRVNANTAITAAYGHIFVTDSTVSQTAAQPGNAARGQLSGRLTGGAVDYLALQMAIHF